MDLYKGIDIPDVEFHRMETNRYVAGEFVWTGIDYLGEPVPFDDKARSSYFGIVDLMGVPKSRYYLYRAHWNEKADTVHIVPHWNFNGLEGQDIFVPVYTNCDELELFANGRSLGRKIIEKYSWGEWSVPYEKGELLCVGYRNGVKVCEDRRVSAGKPVAFRLTLENEVKPNGLDLVFLLSILNFILDISEIIYRVENIYHRDDSQNKSQPGKCADGNDGHCYVVFVCENELYVSVGNKLCKVKKSRKRRNNRKNYRLYVYLLVIRLIRRSVRGAAWMYSKAFRSKFSHH
jgi:hypothetical protein